MIVCTAELFGKRRVGHEEPGVAPFYTADSAEMRGHIEPVQTVGRESQMEHEGVRRIFQARRLREAVRFAGHRHLRSVQQHRAENPDRSVSFSEENLNSSFFETEHRMCVCVCVVRQSLQSPVVYLYKKIQTYFYIRGRYIKTKTLHFGMYPNLICSRYTTKNVVLVFLLTLVFRERSSREKIVFRRIFRVLAMKTQPNSSKLYFCDHMKRHR